MSAIFDPTKTHVTWGSILIQGAMDGEFLTADFQEDGVALHVGSQGLAAFVVNANRTGTFSLILAQSSPTNRDLSLAYANNAIQMFQAEDLSDGTLVKGPETACIRHAPIKRGDKVIGYEWRFACAQLSMSAGGDSPGQTTPPTRLVRIAGYPLDLAVTESHSFPGEATKDPVEQGGDITDHIQDNPLEITIEAIVSDTPSGLVATDSTRQVQATSDPHTVTTPIPSSDALERLRDIKAARQLITVETSRGVFNNMALVDLDVPVDKDKNNALFFTAKFVQVSLVTNRRTRVRVKTSMPTGAKPQAVAGPLVEIDRQIVWKHGVPPGAPFKPGNIVEVVKSAYTPTAGQTPEEIVKFRAGHPGSSAITYFVTTGDEAGAEITGSRRAALVADLERNERQSVTRALEGLNATLDRFNGLPPGLSFERLQLQGLK